MCVKTISLFKLLLNFNFSKCILISLTYIVLVMEPFGEMSLRSCKVKLLQDWYTFFQVFEIIMLMDFTEPLKSFIIIIELINLLYLFHSRIQIQITKKPYIVLKKRSIPCIQWYSFSTPSVEYWCYFFDLCCLQR